MSIEPVKGGEKKGKAAISTWIDYHRHLTQPFLSRNLESGVRYASMGSSLSSSLKPSLKPTMLPQERVIMASDEDDEEDEDPRPAKRRRIAAPIPSLDARGDASSLNGAKKEKPQSLSRLPGKFQSLKPLDFYGSSTSSSLAQPIAKIASKVSPCNTKGIDSALRISRDVEPVNFERLLKICVTGIRHDSRVESTARGSVKAPFKISCTARLSRKVFIHDVEGETKEIKKDLYQQQDGLLHRSYDDGPGVFKMSLPPFHFSAAGFFQDGEFEHDTNAKFNVLITIHPTKVDTGFSKDSNLVKELAASDEDLRHIYALQIRLPIFESEWTKDTKRIFAKYDDDPPKETSALLDVDMQWSLLNHTSGKDMTILQSQHLGQYQLEKFPTPDPVHIVAASIERRPSEDLDSGSPARAHRRRGNVTTYNLKALSNKAQGRVPKTQKKSQRHIDARSGSLATDDDPDAPGVVYSFNKADSSEYGIKQKHIVSGRTCPVCSAEHKTLEALRFHLTTNHARFKFHLRGSNPPRYSFFVEINQQKNKGHPTINHPSRIVQLGRATTLLDMEKYLAGDQSWLKSRHGSLHEQWPEHLKHHKTMQSQSSSSENSRQNSAEISNGPSSLPARQSKKFKVPKTKNRLFDLVTKRVLKPGEELPDSDDEKEETWLLQKQRDIINDHTDVTDDEKDFLNHWNNFIMPLRLTGDSHLEKAMKRFSAINRVWFAERRARSDEFMKLIEQNIMRGSIRQDIVYYFADQLRQGEKEYAESQRAKNEVDRSSPQQQAMPRKKRGHGICICGEHTKIHDRINCHDVSGRCWGPHFHMKCAEKQGREVNKKKWICNECLERTRLEAEQQ